MFINSEAGRTVSDAGCRPLNPPFLPEPGWYHFGPGSLRSSSRWTPSLCSRRLRLQETSPETGPADPSSGRRLRSSQTNQNSPFVLCKQLVHAAFKTHFSGSEPRRDAAALRGGEPEPPEPGENDPSSRFRRCLAARACCV